MKQILIPELKESLRDLSDFEYQRRVWLSPDGPEFSSFDELVCQVFDDTGLSHVIDKPALEELVGKDAAESLRALNRAASKLEATIPPAEFIMLPEMARLAELACRAPEDLECVETQ
jgi:hypothetical protein